MQSWPTGWVKWTAHVVGTEDRGTVTVDTGAGTPEEQEAETGRSFGTLNQRQAHSRHTAYAAAKTGDTGLAARAWQELYTGHAGYPRDLDWRTERVEPMAVLKPIDETSFASTNASSQYGLAAIQCLALVGQHLPNPVYFGAHP